MFLINPKSKQPLYEQLVEQLRACMDAELTSPQFSITALCQKTGISRAYCNRLFREQFQQTPIYYVNQKRIEKAKRLLLSDHYSNEEIAMLCGFGDVKYFYVVFKKLTGMEGTAEKFDQFIADL